MNGTVSDIQEHVRVKTDAELVSLSSEARDMTPESRLALLAELQRRLDTTIKRSATVQLVHGWYTVFVQGTDIRFPDLCSNCLRKPADTHISIPYMDLKLIKGACIDGFSADTPSNSSRLADLSLPIRCR